MKKKLKENKEEKDVFFRYIKPYLANLEEARFIESKESAFERSSFGWALYLYFRKSQLYVNIVEPKHTLDFSDDNYIRLTENLGILKIKIQDKDFTQTFEIECHQRLSESRQIRFYFNEMNKCIKANTEYAKMKACGLIHLLCGFFAELVFEGPHLTSYFRDTKRQMMIKINSSIRSKMGTAFSAQDVVEDLGYSIQYLNKVSQDFRALSLNNFINFSKLELFRSKLISSKEKIAEIADECGFQDVNYLIQLFKKTYFITPLQLRKKIMSASSKERIELNRISGFQMLNKINKPEKISELSVKDKRVSLIVGNLSKKPLELYWVSPEKEEVPMTLLEGLERIHLGSAEGHVWMLKNEEGTAYFKVGEKNSLIVL